MDYSTLKQNIARCGLTIRQLAELLQINPNSITNLSKKEQMPKNLFIITSLLSQLKEKGVDPHEAFARAGINTKKDEHTDEN